MNITVIFGAIAMVGAVAAFWWGLTATPSKARANLFAGLPQPPAPPGRSDAIMRRVGIAARRVIPHQLVDGLEVKLVQAGHPYGLDLARLLGIKLMLSLGSAFLLMSRAAVVDFPEMVRQARSGRIKVATDVFPDEPVLAIFRSTTSEGG